MSEQAVSPERRLGIFHFSLRGAFAATAVVALMLAALNEPRGIWPDLLVLLALAGLAFQSVAAFAAPRGSARLPPLASAVFGWTGVIGLPSLRSMAVSGRGWDTILGQPAGPSVAVILLLAIGVWAGRYLARRVHSDPPRL